MPQGVGKQEKIFYGFTNSELIIATYLPTQQSFSIALLITASHAAHIMLGQALSKDVQDRSLLHIFIKMRLKTTG